LICCDVLKIDIKMQYKSLQECSLEDEEETITLTALLEYKLNLRLRNKE